jgi:hypothetical protein
MVFSRLEAFLAVNRFFCGWGARKAEFASWRPSLGQIGSLLTGGYLPEWTLPLTFCLGALCRDLG